MNSSQPANPNASLDSLVYDISSMLESDGLPKQCAVCKSACRSVHDISIDHELFQLRLPLPVCPTCAGFWPFTSRRRRSKGVEPYFCLVLALVFVFKEDWPLAGMALLTAVGIFVWQQFGPQSSLGPVGTSLNDLLGTIRPYQALLSPFRDATLKLTCQGKSRERKSFGESKCFVRSVRMRQHCSLLVNEKEIQKAGLPSVILESYFEIINSRVKHVWRESANDEPTIVQVGLVLLPGRRLEFDIAVISKAESSIVFRDHLKRELDSVPAWPVAYPVVLALLRIFGDVPVNLDSTVPSLFSDWAALLDPSETDRNITFAELAMRFYDVKPLAEPLVIEWADCEAIRHFLPESTPLQFFRAAILRGEGRFDEALSIYDSLLKDSPELGKEIATDRTACLAEAGQFERAAAYCQQQIAQHPDHSRLYAMLAQLQIQMNQPEEALRTLDRVGSDRYSSGILHIRAQILVRLERLDEAVSSLNLAIFQDLDFAPGYLFRAQLYLHQSRAEDALADLAQFHRCADVTLESLQAKTNALLALGRPQEAEENYRAVIEQRPLDLPLRLQWSEFLANIGKLESAKEECDAVLAQAGPVGLALAIRSAVCLELNQWESAIADADRAIELGANGPKTWLVRGLAKAALGQLDEAFEDLDACLDAAPHSPFARFHRGRLRVRQQEFESAVTEFTLALEMVPHWIDALIERGYAHLGLEQPIEAGQDFDKAVELAPERANAYTGRAITRMITGNKRGASEDLDKAVALDPSDVNGRMNRALILLQNHEAELAREDLNQILEMEPDFQAALFRRAHIHLNMGQYEEARQDFDRLIKIDPNVPEFFVGRSVASEQAGDSQSAEADREHARQVAPFSSEELGVSHALLAASVAARNEQYERAVHLATEAINEHPTPLWDAHRIRAHALWYSENFVEALEDYALIIDQSDEATRHDWSAYGQVLAELGEFEQALNPLDRSIKIAEETQDQIGLAFSLNGKGRALAGLGRFAEAEVCFSRSLELKPDNAWLHFNRGLMYVERNQPSQAIACFELALSVSSPKLTPAKRLRAEGFIKRMRGSHSVSPPDSP